MDEVWSMVALFCFCRLFDLQVKHLTTMQLTGPNPLRRKTSQRSFRRSAVDLIGSVYRQRYVHYVLAFP